MTDDETCRPDRHRSRATRLAVLALTLVLAATACGGGGESDADQPEGAPTDGVEGSGEGAVDLGERVVALGEEDLLADLLALGVEPVASSATVPEAGFQGLDDHDTSGIEVLPMTTLGMEQLAALRPDTIVTLQFWVDQADEATLRGMADLVVVPDGLDSAAQITELGELLGKQDDASAIVADLAQAQERASAEVPDDCAVSVAAIYPGPTPAAFVDGPWVIPSSLLDAGCRLVPDATEVEPDSNGRVYLSLEQLGLLDAPVLLLLQSEAVEGDSLAVEELAAGPLWAGLPAVESGSVVEVDRLGYPGATGHIRFLEELPELLGQP